MFPSRFAYQRAATLEAAVEVLATAGEETKILAGGQSLIPLMKFRLTAPARLLDISRLSELRGIRTENGWLGIGALTRHVDLERYRLPSGLDILNEGARVIGDPQVRNMGTIGGALAEADPAGDWGAVLLSLPTSIVCRSSNGERVIPLREFFLDAYTPALAAHEILTELRIALLTDRSGGAYIKLERKSGDFAIVSAAVTVQIGKRGEIEGIGIGLSGVGLTPVKAVATEALLKGKEPGDGLVAQASATLAGEVQPLSDLRGSADYKREVAQVLFRRALEMALKRANKRA